MPSGAASGMTLDDDEEKEGKSEEKLTPDDEKALKELDDDGKEQEVSPEDQKMLDELNDEGKEHEVSDEDMQALEEQAEEEYEQEMSAESDFDKTFKKFFGDTKEDEEAIEASLKQLEEAENLEPQSITGKEKIHDIRMIRAKNAELQEIKKSSFYKLAKQCAETPKPQEFELTAERS